MEIPSGRRYKQLPSPRPPRILIIPAEPFRDCKNTGFEALTVAVMTFLVEHILRIVNHDVYT